MSEITDNDDEGTEIEHADDVPVKQCQWQSTYTGKPCGNDATVVKFDRLKHRVENGIHISTKVRPVFLCDEHDHIGVKIPPEEAKVVDRG